MNLILGPHHFCHRLFIVLTFRGFSASLIPLTPTPPRHPQSLSYGFNMHRLRRRAPDRFRISSIGAKARALAMLGVSQHPMVRICFRGQRNRNPFSIPFLLDVFSVSWDLEISSGLLFPSFSDVACSNWQYCDICKCWELTTVWSQDTETPTAICGVMGFPICKEYIDLYSGLHWSQRLPALGMYLWIIKRCQ